jgi:asparagine synthetase B (glutamine-hydrolysing)
MRAADVPRFPDAPKQERPYSDWLLVVSRRGELELSSGDGAASGSAEPLECPRIARNGQCSALLDGVLHNRAELESRLRVAGSTDSELALDAYLRWGEGALSELKGIYVLVVGDREHEGVLCARDRLGSHPLFYADCGGQLLLSTSIEVLLRDPRVSGKVSRAALADHLAHRWPDPGETYFSAVRRVPPGHALVAGPGGHRVKRYWSPVASDGQIDWVTEDELEQFEELLDQAVARLLALGPAGIYLSGGLDSVSVAAMAARSSREQGLPAPWALSLGFSHQEADEQAIQRSVAGDLDLPQLLVPFEEAAGPDGLMAATLELNGRSPAPVVNMWLPAYHYLATRGRQRGCRVILTGHGGDEWLSVTPFYAADLILSLDLKGLFRLWDNHRRSYPIPAPTILRNIVWRFGTRPLLGLAADRIAPEATRSVRRRHAIRTTPAWVAPDPVLRQELAERTKASIPVRPQPGQIYLSEMNRALDHALVAMELEEAFESGRQLGLRFGHPLWDADLLTFLYRTPPELLNQGGRSKGLVRGMLGRRFPELGFERQRKVTGTPVVRGIVAREGKVAWRRMGGATALAELGVVDEGAVSTLVAGILDETTPPEKNEYAYRVWDILALEAWVRPRL